MVLWLDINKQLHRFTSALHTPFLPLLCHFLAFAFIPQVNCHRVRLQKNNSEPEWPRVYWADTATLKLRPEIFPFLPAVKRNSCQWKIDISLSLGKKKKKRDKVDILPSQEDQASSGPKKKKKTSTPTQSRHQILLTSFSVTSVSKLLKMMNFGFRMLPFLLLFLLLQIK